MRHAPLQDDPADTILKPLSPLAAAVEDASLDDLALFAIAVNRRARHGETLPSDLHTHASASLPRASSLPKH